MTTMSVAALQSALFTATLLLKFTCKEVGAPITFSMWVLVLRWCEGLKSVLRVNSLSFTTISRLPSNETFATTKYWEHAPLETPTGALWMIPKEVHLFWPLLDYFKYCIYAKCLIFSTTRGCKLVTREAYDFLKPKRASVTSEPLHIHP